MPFRSALDSDGHITISVPDLERTYGRGRQAVHALRGVTLEFPVWSFTAVMGPSGSGKGTLIQCAAGLDSPTGTLIGSPSRCGARSWARQSSAASRMPQWQWCSV